LGWSTHRSSVVLFGIGVEFRALGQSYQFDDGPVSTCSLMIFAGPALCPLCCAVLCCDVDLLVLPSIVDALPCPPSSREMTHLLSVIHCGQNSNVRSHRGASKSSGLSYTRRPLIAWLLLASFSLRRVSGWSTQMAMELGSPVGTFHGSALSLRRSGAMSFRLLSVYCIIRLAAL